MGAMAARGAGPLEGGAEGGSGEIRPASPPGSPPGSSPLFLPPPSAPRPHILLGLTGSVASIKAPLLVRLLSELGTVRVVASASARHFFDAADLPDSVGPVLGSESEWRAWKRIGDPVLHIELRKWADLLVIAPISANALAKVSLGMADDLLTCVARAWDFSRSTPGGRLRFPLLIAPAMNTAMWDHPATAEHLDRLRAWGVGVVSPVAKTLACGDVGVGAMASVQDIQIAVGQALEKAVSKKGTARAADPDSLG